ncbi:MAG: hypothetical protein JO199_07330 [Candidatus Eremiobacteraeota bacterium]|nr:hypothetical protein [Candidatus Eremiobacteraeota bacterium]
MREPGRAFNHIMNVRPARFLLVVALAAVEVAACDHARAQSRAYLYSYGSEVQTPGHRIELTYGTDTGNPPIAVRVYRISGDAYVTALRGRRDLDGSIVDGAPQVASGKSLAAKSDDWNRKVVLDALPVGTYAIVAKTADARTVNLLDVTTLGIAQASAYARDGVSLYVPIDIRTFNRYGGGVTLTLVDDTGRRDVPVENGIGRAAPASTSSAVMVARGSDGSLAAYVPYSYASQQMQAGYVQTDRPVYRPGDTIALRAIVRDGNIGAYRLPKGSLHVRVQAPDGSDVLNRDVPVSAFGSVSASLRLPDDAATGSYTATIGNGLVKNIVVAAYKKPEYELDFDRPPSNAIGGDPVGLTVVAKYFFGRPAGGMKLHYTVYSEPHWYDEWWGPYGEIAQSDRLWERGGRNVLSSGDTTTGDDGRATLPIATTRAKEDTDLSIQVDGRDASGRTVTTSTDLLVTAAAFRLQLESDEWFGQARTEQTVRVHARTYDGDTARPNVPVHVEFAGRRWVDDKEVTTSRQRFDVTTDAKGDASIRWTPPADGDYVATATAADENGRTATGLTYVWELGANDESWLAPIERPMLVASRSTVAPGSRATFVVAVPKRGRDVIVMSTTDRIASAQIVHVNGTAAEVSVDVPSDAPTLNATAMLPNENGVEFAYATIKVHPAARALLVSISPSKRRYLPGENARFAVRVTDANGKPQRTELGIGVVDESTYAVQADDSGSPLDSLYGGSAYVYGNASWFRPNREVEKVETAREATVAPAGAPAPQNSQPQAQVRSNFLDTAYWSPSVVTGDDGRATIAFAWPDNLTTWRATGIGVTVDGDVGKGTGSALVTKDFLVRLETPRFLRAGDRSTLVGIAQGRRGHPDVRMRLDAGALAKDPFDAALTLDRFQSASASWPVVAPGVGSTPLELSGTDGELSDAMRLPLPLEAGTAAEHRRDAGSAATRPTFVVHVPPGYLGGAVHVTLAPSLVAELVQNQRLLDVYPYYCTEQTMSTSLPAVFIGRVLREAHLKPPGDLDVETIVAHAVARLGQLQHEDGSWGWWEYDDAHPFMTAYAMYGLAEFRKDGYVVPNATFDRGVDNLVSQLANADTDTLAFWGGAQPGSEWNTRAFMLFALADAAPGRVDRNLLEKTAAHAGELNPYAIAVLGLAEHWLGNDDAARRLLAELDKRSVTNGPFRFWRGDSWHYRWEDDPIETTAYALRLELAMGAGRARIDEIVNFLRSQRRGDWWYTTKDTAAAVYALSEAIRPDSSEFTPDETVRVLVDGREIRSLHVTTAVLDASDASTVVPQSLVHDGTRITLERAGRGALYWASDAIRYVPADARSLSDDANYRGVPSLEVRRSYQLRHSGPWRVGDEIVVTVAMRAHGEVQYVALEDPFPAGAEHQPDQGRADDDSWSGIQLFDDRAVFFADRLDAREWVTVRYTLRATVPGTYAAPAPTIYAMYGPPVSALGKSETVRILP